MVVAVGSNLRAEMTHAARCFHAVTIAGRLHSRARAGVFPAAKKRLVTRWRLTACYAPAHAHS